MPISGAKYRGMAMGKAQTLIQSLITNREFKEWIELAQEEDLNIYEKALIRVLKREMLAYEKLPKDFLEEYERAVSISQIVWREAREQKNFAVFERDLENIIILNKKKAHYLNSSTDPYDTLLDIFEEGLSTSFLDEYFKKVLTISKKLREEVQERQGDVYDNLLTELPYKISKIKKLNTSILNYFGYDKDRLRLDSSTHPFSEGLSTDDVRITTRYEGKDFAKCLSSTIHEFGHALYSLQHNPELNTTSLFTNSSLGIHESQSRFFENIIGRSKAFIEKNIDNFHMLGENYINFEVEDYYKYFNLVKPGFIRVEADEITYHTHIYIRYQIEKELIAGTLAVSDLPGRWNGLYEEHLGVRPTNDAEGCLQDIHWSMGAIGYFPTYSVGTVFASQFTEKLEAEIGNVDMLILEESGIEKIKKWLAENIHQYGATYTLDQLANRLTGNGLSTIPWERYLNEKYRSRNV